MKVNTDITLLFTTADYGLFHMFHGPAGAHIEGPTKLNFPQTYMSQT